MNGIQLCKNDFSRIGWPLFGLVLRTPNTIFLQRCDPAGVVWKDWAFGCYKDVTPLGSCGICGHFVFTNAWHLQMRDPSDAITQ